MKIEKFQLRGNNSACAGAFQLLRGRAPSRLWGKSGTDQFLTLNDNIMLLGYNDTRL
jgi:hypothetical protein